MSELTEYKYNNKSDKITCKSNFVLQRVEPLLRRLFFISCHPFICLLFAAFKHYFSFNMSFFPSLGEILKKDSLMSL